MSPSSITIAYNIIEEFKKIPHHDNSVFSWYSTDFTLADTPIEKIRFLSSLSWNAIRFDNTHILLNSVLRPLEPITPEHEFNLRLILNEDEFEKYSIAAFVVSKIKLFDCTYISANISSSSS